jgi:hypothetical protein
VSPVEQHQAGEVPASESPPTDEHYDRPVDKFHRTAVGSISMAWMLGLRDALEGRPEKEEPAIVMEAPTQPPHGNIDLVIDPEHPERAVVYVRRSNEDNSTR